MRRILTVLFSAILYGTDERTEVEQFGEDKLSLFQDTIGVAQIGLLSHDTFGRLRALLNREPFRECFWAWIKLMIAISGDGKTIRGEL